MAQYPEALKSPCPVNQPPSINNQKCATPMTYLKSPNMVAQVRPGFGTTMICQASQMGPYGGVPVPSGGKPIESVKAPTLGTEKHSWSNSRGYGYNLIQTTADKSNKLAMFAYPKDRLPQLAKQTDTLVKTSSAWSSN